MHLAIVMYWLPSTLQTTALKNGALRHDIHYWLGKDTTQVSLKFYIGLYQNLSLWYIFAI